MIAQIARGAVNVALATSLLAGSALAQDIDVFRVGLLGGENEADRLRKNDCLVQQLGEILGVPVDLYPASD